MHLLKVVTNGDFLKHLQMKVIANVFYLKKKADLTFILSSVILQLMKNSLNFSVTTYLRNMNLQNVGRNLNIYHQINGGFKKKLKIVNQIHESKYLAREQKCLKPNANSSLH